MGMEAIREYHIIYIVLNNLNVKRMSEVMMAVEYKWLKLTAQKPTLTIVD